MSIRSNPDQPQDELFRSRLENMIDMNHPLVKLGEGIDWEVFDREFGKHYAAKVGRPATRTRLIVGLTYLQFMYDLSDEAVVERWVESPYWQHFTGEEYFQHDFPLHPTTLVKWRRKIGEEGCEWLLTQTLQAGKKLGVLKTSSLDKVVVDTTCMEKAIAHPVDSKLFNRMREHLVREAESLNITLRQNYNQVAPQLVKKAARYGHAKQYARVRKASNKLRTILGRVIRDIERKVETGNTTLTAKMIELLALAKRLKAQQRNSKDKVYAIHAPEVACIAKGKARNPYEFGAKVSIAVTAKDSWVVGARTFKGNPYDGHTLEEAFDQIKAITDRVPKQVYVDRGYRAAYLGQQTDVIITGQKRHSKATKRWMKRRNSVEPIIGHLKAGHKMQRNWLKGHLGDIMAPVLAASGFNLKKILRALALFAPKIYEWIMGLLADFYAKAENSNKHHKQINSLQIA